MDPLVPLEPLVPLVVAAQEGSDSPLPMVTPSDSLAPWLPGSLALWLPGSLAP